MINVSLPEVDTQLRPRITVFGVGGAGGNAVNNMIKSNLEGVDFVIANTDAQALTGSLAPRRIQLGTTITRGLGAGSRPDVGRAAAEEQKEEILGHLEGANMVFITAGMGGGTGTGAAPVIARLAREQGILTVGVVTKPFHFEGAHRMRLAESGIGELQQYVDTLIIIPNQNLFRIANEKTTFADAFKMADDVLHSGVRGVTDLMVMPGLINLDFADIRSVMTEMGKAMMGTGEATGDSRSIAAAEAAISNPLLDDVSMKGARGVLINITGGYDMTLFEVDEAANRIRDEVDPDANIIFGSTFDQTMEGRMRVSVVATGIDAASMAMIRTQPGSKTDAVATTPASSASSPFSVVSGGKKPGAPTAGAARPGDYMANMVQAPMPPVQQAATMMGAGMGAGPAMATAGNTARAIEPEMKADLNTTPIVPEPVSPAAPFAMTPEAAPMTSEARIAQPQAPAPRMETPIRTPVTGPLRGERKDGTFIAPRPAEAPRPPQHHQSQAEPQAFAAQPSLAAEPASARPTARKPSLFERMTGIRRHAEEPEIQRPAQQPLGRPVSAAPRAGEPVKGGHGTDEDTLDIPAFLRRQTN
ncbi:MAG TPA: cell division protein FtsZ [Azospirillaceae bacterium]|nr:cell division protein FtsZ [Azospirillaceae bacterium]